MTAKKPAGGKLPGKTRYSGRRRSTTRVSGFRVNDSTTGGQFRRLVASRVPLPSGKTTTVTFTINGHRGGELIGYGLWFWSTDGVLPSVQGGPDEKTFTEYGEESWNKAGSMWIAKDDSPVEIRISFSARRTGEVAIYGAQCGRVQHKHLDAPRPELMKNMYQFAPEALFISGASVGEVTVDTAADPSIDGRPLILKSCNRCGRYLPVNVPNERDQLSFSNHCVAAHRRPCTHTTFGLLRNIEDDQDTIRLEYGYQLECRFCKKFEVNAAHNPQRTTAQMKEDGARRRAFEQLLAELYGGTPQLRYRHERGTELAEDVWLRFGKACFNCGSALHTSRKMHLDHTRPLALLWPLDGTATALCGSCNSEKRDRAPSNFYTPIKLKALARFTGISLTDLANDQANDDAIELLIKRLDWFFGQFLSRAEMTKERDGKVTGELVVKALQKVLSRSLRFKGFDLAGKYNQSRNA